VCAEGSEGPCCQEQWQKDQWQRSTTWWCCGGLSTGSSGAAGQAPAGNQLYKLLALLLERAVGLRGVGLVQAPFAQRV